MNRPPSHPTRTATTLLFTSLLTLTACTTDLTDTDTATITSPPRSAHPSHLIPDPIAKLARGPAKENSGIVRSRRSSMIFWMHNDSGDEPRIYPITIDGQVVASTRNPESPGVLIGGAVNSDWEDIALDASGRIIIADFGNNSNARADLTLYFVEEPEPTAERTTYTRKVLFRYPDQTKRPAPASDFNFDAEAIFTVGDEVFILTKNRSDTFTKLYRLATRDEGVVNVLEYIDRFNIDGQATAADASDDGKTLVVLTYERIWLFERDDLTTPFFKAKVTSRAYRMTDGKSDSEAICFESAETLLIADEARAKLYRVQLANIRAGDPK